MARFGVIIEVKGERAAISTMRSTSCDNCAEQESCSTSAEADGKPAEVIDVINPVGAKAGDTVEFDLMGHAELKLSMIVWVIPLAFLIGGAIAGAMLHTAMGLSQDMGVLLLSLAGFAASFGILRAIDRRAAHDPSLTPQVLRVVHRS